MINLLKYTFLVYFICIYIYKSNVYIRDIFQIEMSEPVDCIKHLVS